MLRHEKIKSVDLLSEPQRPAISQINQKASLYIQSVLWIAAFNFWEELEQAASLVSQQPVLNADND